MKVHELLANPENWTKGSPFRLKKNPKIDLTIKNQTETEIVFLSWDSLRAIAAEKDQIPEEICFCVSGGINFCYSDIHVRCQIQSQLENYIEEKFGDLYIESWNDHPDRTHSEVIQVLKELDI